MTHWCTFGANTLPLRTVWANTARRRGLHIVRDDFYLKKSSLIHSVAPPFQIEPAVLGFDLVLGADLKPAASIVL